jgi:hypothetical protein
MSKKPAGPQTPQEPGMPDPRGIGPGPYAVESPLGRIIQWLRRLFGGSGPGEPPLDSRK